MSTSSARTSSSSTYLTGSAKLEDVTKLMDKLASDLKTVSLLPYQRDAILEQVKVYGRDPTNSDPIFTKEGIETLTKHAFNSPSLNTSRNALRCLANALLLRAETRQMFVDLGYEQKACNKLKNDSRDDEFLVSRVIFLTTYNTNIDYEKLIDQHHLAENICQNVGRHAKQYITRQKKAEESDPMEEMALIETMKLMFNITHFCPNRSNAFSPALPHILTILTNQPIPNSKTLDPPISSLLNVLINIPLDSKDNSAVVFPKSTPHVYIDRLVEILQKSVEGYTDIELEGHASPLLTLIWRLYELAPRDVQLHIQKALLPSIEDRNEILGRGTTLPSRLLRLSTNPATPQVRQSISQLLFELSDKDAAKFVQNVGYGFASGFLFQNNVPMPENAVDAWSTSGSEGSAARASQDSRLSDLPGRVNPVTGQLLDMEEIVEMEEMTEEEKEREAERLFVLFERLKATGVMNVHNPVELAVQQGRFEEVDDDSESD